MPASGELRRPLSSSMSLHKAAPWVFMHNDGVWGALGGSASFWQHPTRWGLGARGDGEGACLPKASAVASPPSEPVGPCPLGPYGYRHHVEAAGARFHALVCFGGICCPPPPHRTPRAARVRRARRDRLGMVGSRLPMQPGSSEPGVCGPTVSHSACTLQWCGGHNWLGGVHQHV